MKFPPPFSRAFFISTGLIACYLLTATVLSAQNVLWRPVTPAELEMKTSKVDPKADAEAIFWEVRLDDKKSNKLSYDHYVRVKIFTDRGRERFSKMDIPFTKRIAIEDVAARVTKPDGSVIDLKPGDIIEREIIKAGKSRVLAKSFAVPGIEPGVIVEYQYKETIKNDSANGERLIFQRDIPMQKVSYYVRPAKNFDLHFNYFNMQKTDFVPDRDGYSVATMYDVPAYTDEPYMPPDDEVRRWVYLSYQSFESGFSWSIYGITWSRYLSELLKSDKDIKRKADELTAHATTDDEKLRRIYDFVQKQIRNLSFDRSLTDEQREKIDIKDADDALSKGMGSSMFIDVLFASLVRSAGYDVRLVLAGDRSENFFTPEKFPSPRFVHPAAIAVRVGNELRYFNPATPYLPFGKLLWYEEGVSAMVIAETGWDWKKIPLSTYDKSNALRTGKFTLREDGTLEGKVKVEYSGHEAIIRRHDYYFDSPTKREESFKNSIKSRIGSAEVTNFSIENFDDNAKPLTYQYDIKIPNYAQKSGKRMFLQPGYFEYGVPPVLSSTTRTNNIYFSFPWSEKDSIEIQLPQKFVDESLTSPERVSATRDVALLEISISLEKEKNLLKYDREFHFGGGGNVLFEVKFYAPLKTLFDAISRADAQTVTLKQN